MRLFVLTLVTMVAFAANSVLNRMGLAQAGMDPIVFGSLRLVAGAVMLAALVLVLRGPVVLRGPRRGVGVVSLLVYIFGFSQAYSALEAGIGALVLFGVVQMTMFAGAVITGDRVPALRWGGAAIAFAGLVWMLWPGAGLTVPLVPAALMAVAGIGWGIYSLVGRGAGDPLGATAANFVLAAPVGVVLMLVSGSFAGLSLLGVALALASGALTSGLGYALWYSILPQLGASRAAVAQLTVPVIAIAGGAMLLGEIPSVTFLIATAVVLFGVILSALAK